MNDREQRLKELILRHGFSLAVAESLTAGHLQTAISATSGASNYFAGGITTYNIHQKVRHLGVDRAHAEQIDCVSQRVANEMAAGCLCLFDADLAAATTGYAEPYPQAGVEEPYAHISVCRRGQGVVRELRVTSSILDRGEMQRWVAGRAMKALTDYLEQLEA